MKTEEKLSCIFVELWVLMMDGYDVEADYLQDLFEKYKLIEFYQVKPDEEEEYPEVEVGDYAIVLTKEGRKIADKAKPWTVRK